MQPGDNTLDELKAQLKGAGAGSRNIGVNCLQFIRKGHVIAESGVVFRGYEGYKLHVITWEPNQHYKDYYLNSVEVGADIIREVIKMYK